MHSLDSNNPPLPEERIATSVAGAASTFGMSEGTIRAAIRENKLPSYLVGRRRVLLIADLLAWVTGKQ